MAFRQSSSPPSVTPFLALLCWTSAAAASGARHVHTPETCTEQTVRMRPDNYMRCLLHFGRCVDGAGPYDYGYYDALRRSVAGSCREFADRPDVLPAARRLVYDTTNLYLQRIGRTVYRHEMGMESEALVEAPAAAAAAASAGGLPQAVHRFLVAACTAILPCAFRDSRRNGQAAISPLYVVSTLYPQSR